MRIRSVSPALPARGSAAKESLLQRGALCVVEVIRQLGVSEDDGAQAGQQGQFLPHSGLQRGRVLDRLADFFYEPCKILVS